jgi:hypothetical protein
MVTYKGVRREAEEKLMSLVMTIFSMIAAWMAIAIAMLWGVLRIARRHLPYAQERTVSDHSIQKRLLTPRVMAFNQA